MHMLRWIALSLSCSVLVGIFLFTPFLEATDGFDWFSFSLICLLVGFALGIAAELAAQREGREAKGGK